MNGIIKRELGLWKKRPVYVLAPLGAMLFCTLFFLHHGNVVFFGQGLQCFRIAHSALFHKEADSSSAFTAAEALEESFGRRDIEGRRFFIVERAAGNEVGSASLQGHVVAYHIFDAGGVKYLFYCFPGNHSLVRISQQRYEVI